MAGRCWKPEIWHGIWIAGLVQGLIHDVPTVAELIDRIIAEAAGLISDRLAGVLNPTKEN
ncbi:hypothetical protein [Saccharopolyspora sp. ASAGF58]|uniref:hypothetical protein n=1 Tax=Saccharopolyspora sp. ASAGF58 TaxID=2719023 RepID=UPI0035300274